MKQLLQRLKEQLPSRITGESEEVTEKEDYDSEIISRRQFGKMLGMGSAGVGGMMMFGGNAAATTIDPGFINLDDDDDVQFGNDNDFQIRYDSANNQWELVDDGQGVIYKVDAGTTIVDFMNDINFPNIAGTPSFSGHDHSQAGLSTIPNAGLTNSSLTVGNTSISLGGTGTPEADNLAGNNGTSGQFLQTDGSTASWAEVSGSTFNENTTGENSAIPNTQVTNQYAVQSMMKFGGEGSVTTSSSYSTIPNSDIAVDFDEIKNENDQVYAKVKYHLYNTSSHGVETGETIEWQRVQLDDIQGITYYDGNYFILDNDGIVYVYDLLGNFIEKYELEGGSADDYVGITYYVDDTEKTNVEDDYSRVVGGSSLECGFVILRLDDSSGDWYWDSYFVDFEFRNDSVTSTDLNVASTSPNTQLAYAYSNAELLVNTNGTVTRFPVDDTDDPPNSLGTISLQDNGSDILMDNERDELYELENGTLETANALAYDASTTSYDRKSGSDFDIGGQLGQPDDINATYNVIDKEYVVGERSSDAQRYYLYTAQDGTSDARIVRQNAGTAVTGTEVIGTQNRQWEFLDTGWINLSSESGIESYQIQLKANNGKAKYNSAILYIATPQA